MLRITTERATGGVTRLLLEGRVVGPWVGELARACEGLRESGRSVELQMSGVSFLDGEAVGFVRGLTDQGVVVLGCSPFVREQLEGGSDDAVSAR